MNRAQRRQAARAWEVPREVETSHVSDLLEYFREIHNAYEGVVRLRSGQREPGQLHEHLELEDLDVLVDRADDRAYLLWLTMALSLVRRTRARQLAALGWGAKASDAPGVSVALGTAGEAARGYVKAALEDYVAKVKAVLFDPENVGASPEDVLAEVEAVGAASESRAVLIGVNETLVLGGAVSEARQRAAGADEYIWATMRDDRVRPTHRANEGRRFRWDSPPSETGHPGHDFNCRCVALPIL